VHSHSSRWAQFDKISKDGSFTFTAAKETKVAKLQMAYQYKK